MGPVVWVLLGEMFPNRIRAAALGLAAAGQWVANWLITVDVPRAAASISGLAYGFYAALRGAVVPLRLASGSRRPRAAPGGHARRNAPPRTRGALTGTPRDEPAVTRACGRETIACREDLRRSVRRTERRARTRPAGSGTVAALDGGVHGLGKKILEEAGEVWLAAEHEADDALAEEISQLLYWTQVLMISRGLSLDDVYAKL